METSAKASHGCPEALAGMEREASAGIPALCRLTVGLLPLEAVLADVKLILTPEEATAMRELLVGKCSVRPYPSSSANLPQWSTLVASWVPQDVNVQEQASEPAPPPWADMLWIGFWLLLLTCQALMLRS